MSSIESPPPTPAQKATDAFSGLTIDFSSAATPRQFQPSGESLGVSAFSNASINMSESAAAGEGGGFGSVQLTAGSLSVPFLSGSTVVQILRPDLLCGGIVGTSKSKFCFSLSEDCTVASHKSNPPYPMRPSGLYLRDKSSNVAFIEPTLIGDKLDPDVVTDLLNSENDIEHLKAEFVIIDSQEGTDSATIENSKKNLLRTVSFKTPKKDLSTNRNPNKVTDLVSSFLDFSSIKEDKIRLKELEDPAKSSIALLELEGVTDGLRTSLPKIAGIVDSLEFAVNEKSDLVDGLLQQIRVIDDSIGSKSLFFKSLKMDPTVWGALTDTVATVQQTEADLETKMFNLNKKFFELKSQVQAIKPNNSVDSIQEGLVKLLQSWKMIIQDLVSRVASLEADRRSVQVPVPSSSIPSDPFSNLGITVGTSENGVGAPTHAPSADPNSFSTTDVFESLLSRVDKLEKSVVGRASNLSGAVRLGGVTFTSKDDVGPWLDSKLESPGGMPPFGLFADPQLLLHWVWVVLSCHNTNTAREIRDRVAIEMTQDKMFAIDSYQHQVPLLLTGKKTSVVVTGGMDKSRLPQIPDFVSWDDPVGENGLKQQLAEALTLVKESLLDLISDNFADLPDLRAFALTMLHTSVSFIENLSTYISETYNNFKDVVGNGDSVWGLITFVVEQIFKKDFGQVRSKTIGAVNPNERTSALRIIWCSIRSVDVARQFITHGIKNAPPVSASYVRFVITHSNMGKVTSLLAENAILKTRLTKVEESLASVKRICETAKRTADQAMTKATSGPKKKKKKKASEDDDSGDE